jgi:peptide deformylase
MELITDKKNHLLRQPAKPVDRVTPEIRNLIREMRQKMKQWHGVGLAAPQIGVDKRIFVAEIGYTPETEGKFCVLINPEIISRSAKTNEMEEGCLSIPGKAGTISRHERITIQGLDEMGKKKKIKASGFWARVFQHEVDHLEGKLFIDRATNLRDVDSPAL